RGRCDGQAALSGVLPALRPGGERGTRAGNSGLAHSNGWSVRCDLRCDGGVPSALSACAREHAVLVHHLYPGDSSASLAGTHILVRAPGDYRIARTHQGEQRGDRRGSHLGERGWFCGRWWRRLPVCERGGCPITFDRTGSEAGGCVGNATVSSRFVNGRSSGALFNSTPCCARFPYFHAMSDTLDPNKLADQLASGLARQQLGDESAEAAP